MSPVAPCCRLVAAYLGLFWTSGYGFQVPPAWTATDALTTRASVSMLLVEGSRTSGPVSLQPSGRRQFLKGAAVSLIGLGSFSAAEAAGADDHGGVLVASPQELPNRSPYEMQYELFKRGMDLEADSNMEAAEAQWTEIIENFESPGFRTEAKNKYLLSRAYSNRGSARLALHRTREAILDYSVAIDLEPDRAEFWLSRGTAYEDMADRQLVDSDRMDDARSFYESALADYDHAAVLNPNEPRIYMARGDTLNLLEQHQDALANYRKAVKLNPVVPDYRAKVALAEIQCGNLERGALMVKALLRRMPDYPEMLLAGAACAWQFGELAESQDMYNEAVAMEPRLMDDDYMFFVLRWPAVPSSMVKTLRRAGTENRIAAVRTLTGASI